MRKIPAVLAVLFIFLTNLNADDCPEEWLTYVSGGYIYDIQSGSNESGMDETTFRNYLTDLARTNIARSMSTEIKDQATLSRQSSDGRTSVGYSSVTRFSTDLELNLVKCESVYDRKTRTGQAIAYISIREAREFYENRILVSIRELENALSSAEGYSIQGYGIKARDILEKSIPLTDGIRSDLFMLNYFGIGQERLSALADKLGNTEETVRTKMAEYGHGTYVHIECRSSAGPADESEEMEDILKALLSEKGCSPVGDTESADWTITADISSREYGPAEIGGMKIYTAYIDAAVEIVNSKGSRTAEIAVSEKGTHTMNFDEAFRDAARKAGSALSEKIYMTISK